MGTALVSLVFICLAGVLAPLLAEWLRKLRIPAVVIEIGLGIVIGPQVLDLAQAGDLVQAFANLGLCFLIFLAGYDIDLNRMRGKPLNRAVLGWSMSLAVGFVLAYLLVTEGFALSTLIIGLAITTTALGTLLPMLSDAGVTETRFGAFVLAIGSVGEFGPIVAIALLLTSDNPVHTAALLALFVVLAVIAVLLAARPTPPRVVALLSKHLNSSSQLPVRISVLVVILLVWVASELGLDILLGAFAAGVVVRLFITGDDAPVVQSKLEAISFGFVIPLFFVVSGMTFDLNALTSDPTTLLRVPMFLAMFLLARGLPALLLYRDLALRERASLAFFSATALPLVVVITGIGTATDRILAVNAAALVGAGMLSVLVFPIAGFRLLGGSPRSAPAAPAHSVHDGKGGEAAHGTGDRGPEQELPAGQVAVEAESAGSDVEDGAIDDRTGDDLEREGPDPLQSDV